MDVSPVSEQGARNTDDELLWDSLLEYIAAGSIVPVIGRELLTIKGADGVDRSLYAELAGDLARRFGKPVPESPEEANPLGAVASQFLLNGGDWRKIYASLNRVLDDRGQLLRRHRKARCGDNEHTHDEPPPRGRDPRLLS